MLRDDAGFADVTKRVAQEMIANEGVHILAGFGLTPLALAPLATQAKALHDISFSLAEGRSLALLGRNGVGKTTLINSLIGVTRRTAGAIRLGGQDVTGFSPERRAHAGVGWVP